MNRGLVLKSFREAWCMTLLFGIGLAAFEAILVYVFPKIIEDFAAQFLQIAFVRNVLKGVLGSEIGDAFEPGMISTFAWIHPIVLALAWAHAIALCTRTPAGEIDRGTVDLLLSLPVTRTGTYVSASVVCLVAGLALLSCGFAANVLAGRFVAPELRIPLRQLLVVVANFYALYVAVAGFSLMVSAVSDHRGRAVGVVFAVVLASFLLNFLSQFWNPAKAVAFLSVLHYYRPLLIVRDGVWPVSDIAVLAGVGVIAWGVGAVIFARRDIRTV